MVSGAVEELQEIKEFLAEPATSEKVVFGMSLLIERAFALPKFRTRFPPCI